MLAAREDRSSGQGVEDGTRCLPPATYLRCQTRPLVEEPIRREARQIDHHDGSAGAVAVDELAVGDAYVGIDVCRRVLPCLPVPEHLPGLVVKLEPIIFAQC